MPPVRVQQLKQIKETPSGGPKVGRRRVNDAQPPGGVIILAITNMPRQASRRHFRALRGWRILFNRRAPSGPLL